MSSLPAACSTHENVVSLTSQQRERQVRNKSVTSCVCCVVSFHRFHYNDLLPTSRQQVGNFPVSTGLRNNAQNPLDTFPRRTCLRGKVSHGFGALGIIQRVGRVAVWRTIRAGECAGESVLIVVKVVRRGLSLFGALAGRLHSSRSTSACLKCRPVGIKMKKLQA